MKKAFLRKLFFFTALAGLAAGFTGAASAQQRVPPGCNNAGPGGGIWGVMQRQSQVMQARNRAWSGAIRENDTSLGATCFDRAMALSSRLGTIFADKPTKDILPANTKVFMWDARLNQARPGGIYNIYAGLGIKTDPVTGQPMPNTLGQAMAVGVVNTLDDYMGGLGNITYPVPSDLPAPVNAPVPGMARDDVNSGRIVTTTATPTANFGGSLGGAMGSTGTTAMAGMVNGTTVYLTGFTPTMNTIVTDPATGIAAIATEVSKLQDVLGGALGGPGIANISPIDVLLTGVGQIYTQVGAVMTLDAQVFQAMDTAINGAGGYVPAYLDLNTGYLGSAATSMSGLTEAQRQAGATAPPGSGCNAMGYTWHGRPAGIPADPAVPTGPAAVILPAVAGLIGSGPAQGMTYGAYADVMTGGPPGSGIEMQGMVNNGDNALSFSVALEDNTKRLRTPPQPGNPDGLTSWKAPPPDTAFQVTTGPATPADIIRLMN